MKRKEREKQEEEKNMMKSVIPAGEVGSEAKCCRGEDSSTEKQDAASSQLLRAVEQLPVDEVDIEEEDGNEGDE